ncbi:hemerythrin domain-containing protein [Nocardia sp. CA-120079]|uniref:hemerythrin domain-containing protein n=1 Tax=Nocardia sp. CA-120079 TaxID=3239974 RepID=UPI003D950B9A
MDALTFLRNDHESVLGMIELLERGSGDGEIETRTRSDLATSLVIAASQHEAVEEQFFWPAVRRTLAEGDKLADTAIQQEDLARWLRPDHIRTHRRVPAHRKPAAWQQPSPTEPATCSLVEDRINHRTHRTPEILDFAHAAHVGDAVDPQCRAALAARHCRAARGAASRSNRKPHHPSR